MYEFRVLGTVDLRGPDGRRIGSLLSQPKRLSLLALLALESPRRLQRDEVVGRLWPELTDERARSALRQALHYLRRSLGPDVIAGKGAEGIGVAPGTLECDATELLRAAAEGRFGDALDLYAGELLPGFHLDGAPMEFEEWLEDARRRVQRTAADAARQVATEEEARGNAVAAGAAARRAWELGEWGEPALRELLELLIRTGDTSGARAAYDDFAERLLREHGAEPSPATRQILARLSAGSGAPAGEPSPGEESTPVAVAAPAAETTRAVEGPARWSRTFAGPPATAWWAGAAAVLVAVLVTSWSLGVGTAEGAADELSTRSGAARLYLEPVRDLRVDGPFTAMAEATTTELAARLSETSGFLVVASSPDDALTGGHGVRLRSTLRDVGGRLQLSVLLLDPSSGAVLERLAVTVEGDSRAGPELLSGRMGARVRQAVGDVLTFRGLADRGIHPDALEAVREAAREMDGADGLRVRGATEAAALAYEATDSLLSRAAAVERKWAEPTLRRAEVSLRAMWLHLIPPRYDRDLAHGEILRGLRHAEAGLAIAPEDGRAREVRGVLRYWAAQTAPDKRSKTAFMAQAEGDLEAAIRTDPELPRAWSILSAISEKRGDFADAYHRARQAYVTDHESRTPSDILARLFTNGLEAGDPAGAAEWCGEIRRQQPENWLGPYCDLTHRAWVGPWVVAESDSLLEEGLRLLPSYATGGELERRFELTHAVVLARAGQGAAARELLAKGDRGGPPTLEVLDLQAWVRTALGENGRARDLLAMAAELNPNVAPRVLRSRRYSDLTTYAVVRND